MVSRIETNPDFTDWAALEALLRHAYAPMEGRIDPPSFLTTMTQADIAAKALAEDLFLARHVACGFGAQLGDVYEIGKVAVAQTHRKQGLARDMMDNAAIRARALGASILQLYARIELTDNHATYRALDFREHAEFTHPGYTRTTALIFRRAV